MFWAVKVEVLIEKSFFHHKENVIPWHTSLYYNYTNDLLNKLTVIKELTPCQTPREYAQNLKSLA